MRHAEFGSTSVLDKNEVFCGLVETKALQDKGSHPELVSGSQATEGDAESSSA